MRLLYFWVGVAEWGLEPRCQTHQILFVSVRPFCCVTTSLREIELWNINDKAPKNGIRTFPMGGKFSWAKLLKWLNMQAVALYAYVPTSCFSLWIFLCCFYSFPFISSRSRCSEVYAHSNMCWVRLHKKVKAILEDDAHRLSQCSEKAPSQHSCDKST